MISDLWHSLVASLTSSTQGPFMHASWIFVALMTIVMTTIAIGRILPSRKARRLRRSVTESNTLEAWSHEDEIFQNEEH